MPRRVILFTATTTLVATACGGLSNDGVRTIHAWLTCDDCGSGERGAVALLGSSAVPELGKALAGPSASQRTIMRNKFDTSYKLAEMGTRVPGLTQANYSAFRDANYLANYQKRAALSLGDIGGDAARRALDAAIADSVSRQYRSDVIRVIKFSRSRLDATTYAGKIKPYRVAFADSVNIVADSGHHFNGQERVVIEDSLFPPSQVPSVVVGDSIKFVSVAAFGLHMISVTEAPNTPPEKIAMFVTSIVDPSDRSNTCGSNDLLCMITNAPPIPVGHPSAPPTFLSVSNGTPKDATDFFKIQNPSAAVLPVTAHLDWRGDGLLDLGWKRCGSVNVVGHTAQGTTTHTVQLSDPIPAGQCWVLQVSFANGQGPAYGQLVMTSP
jgi:hypothetical protein